jgi:hypothetical protein
LEVRVSNLRWDFLDVTTSAQKLCMAVACKLLHGCCMQAAAQATAWLLHANLLHASYCMAAACKPPHKLLHACMQTCCMQASCLTPLMKCRGN